MVTLLQQKYIEIMLAKLTANIKKLYT